MSLIELKTKRGIFLQKHDKGDFNIGIGFGGMSLNTFGESGIIYFFKVSLFKYFIIIGEWYDILEDGNIINKEES